MTDNSGHNRYGDTPLGKSDEQLREEGASADTNSERQSGRADAAEPSAPLIVPGLAGAGAVVPVVIDPQESARVATDDERNS